LTIVVIPLIILKEDLIDRAQAAGIDNIHVWGKEDIRKVSHFNLAALRGILFVTTDLATSGAFLTFLSAQDTQYHALARIFIDEVQQCLAEYRSEVMSNLYNLQSNRTGWVLTSATIPPEHEKVLFDILATKPLVLRPDGGYGIGTQRLNLQYQVCMSR
jgi:superfamily II DNA helicase RecQ